MSEEIKHNRRRFLCTAAMTFAAGQVAPCSGQCCGLTAD